MVIGMLFQLTTPYRALGKKGAVCFCKGNFTLPSPSNLEDYSFFFETTLRRHYGYSGIREIVEKLVSIGAIC